MERETDTTHDATVTVARRRRTIQADDATRIVQLGAAVLLGGGFYYGYTKQQRAAKKEMKLKGRVANIKPREPAAHVVRPVTIFERKLGLHRPQSSASAAFRALIGGTIMAGTGAAVLLLGVGAALGARNPTEFRERMEDVTQKLGIPPTVSEFGSEEAELEHLAKIFEDGMREEYGTSPVDHQLQVTAPDLAPATRD